MKHSHTVEYKAPFGDCSITVINDVDSVDGCGFGLIFARERGLSKSNPATWTIRDGVEYLTLSGSYEGMKALHEAIGVMLPKSASSAADALPSKQESQEHST